MELHRKYRPKTFDDVVGNENTVESLRNYIEAGTLPHTMLIEGSTGSGKTTLARIIRRELKCSSADFKEYNSADVRGIDTVRDLIRKSRLKPRNGPVCVWLMDEMHMMSKDAQTAALKMTEEPPDHVYFILCTTDGQKLLPTLRDRCQKFPVRSLNDEQLVSLGRRVAKAEKIKLTDKDFETLAENSMGSARSLLVLLEKAASVSSAKLSEAIATAAAAQNEAIDLCKALIDRRPWKQISSILSNLKGEAETLRYNVLGFARWSLLKTGSWQAYNVIVAFSNPFYESKDAGLAAACYEAVNAKED